MDGARPLIMWLFQVYQYDSKSVQGAAEPMMVLQTPIGSVVVPVGTNPVDAIKVPTPNPNPNPNPTRNPRAFTLVQINRRH